MTKTILFVGRFQPLHDGHKACIQQYLDQGCHIIVGIRTGPLTESNPYSYMERRNMVKTAFPQNHVQTVYLPDPGHTFAIAHGRKVGYEVIRLGEELESISATKIRENQK